MCCPFQSILNNKYRIKLVPGNLKKGKGIFDKFLIKYINKEIVKLNIININLSKF